jgi:single-strand DNA-binding protein
MNNDLNHVNIIGRLVRDIDLKYIKTGSAVVAFTIANNRTNKEKKEDVSYFDCVAWGNQAEIIAKYLKKGRRLGVEGRLKQRRWEDKDGKAQSKIEINIDNFQFLDTIKPQDLNDSDKSSISPGNDKNLFDDDIPF